MSHFIGFKLNTRVYLILLLFLINIPAQKLRLLPENTKYFEYNGLPLVMFCYQGGKNPVPTDGANFGEVASYANHYYATAHDTWVRATWSSAESKMTSDGHWNSVRSWCQSALEKDVIVSLIFWSYKWNYGSQDWSGTDVFNRPQSAHSTSIQKAVNATWDLPNVTYNFMWEYNVRRGMDSDGSFHRWWVDKFYEYGRNIDPNIEHLFSIEYGGTHPDQNNAHFIVEEDGNGFWRTGANPSKVAGYNCPLVFWASDRWYNDQTAINPDQVRRQLVEGYHPGESFASPNGNALKYYLQARWYAENIKTWGNEPGDEISDNAVPRYNSSSRPSLSNAPGYNNGAKSEGEKLSFSCIYRDSDGDAPALAEVWIDMNGDERFSPNSSDGERFEMTGSGSNYNSGVTYTITDIQPTFSGNRDTWYVFRFADKDWNPPQTGGVIHNKNSGSNYSHWTINAQGSATSSADISTTLNHNKSWFVINRVKNSLFIQSTNPSRQMERVRLIDLTGRVIIDSNVENSGKQARIKITDISRNIYCIQLVDNNGEISQLLVK